MEVGWWWPETTFVGLISPEYWPWRRASLDLKRSPATVGSFLRRLRCRVPSRIERLIRA